MIPSYPRPLIVLSFALLAGAALGAEPPLPDGPRSTFLFGGDYPAKPKPEISRLFEESGLNAIRITGGGYAWALGTHAPQAEEFEKRGLHVYLQLGSHYPDSEYFKLKDAWLVDHKGETGVEDRKAWAIGYSGSFWPQYRYTSDGFRKRLDVDFAKYMAAFKERKNIAGVILHNEPGYHWIKDRIFDYSPGTIAKFKIWLEKTHGNVATLNERWGSSYTSFDEITPPGQPPLTGPSVPAWLDWRRFHVTAIADFLAWEAAFFKTLRPDIPRTTNLDGAINNWYPYRLADMEAYSRAMDVVGIDIYPTEWTKNVIVPYAMDMAQGVAQGRPVHVMECETFSAKKWKFPEADRARMLRAQLWSMIGHGADGIFVWGFSRDDDFSLTNGEVNPRYLSMRDMAAAVKMIGIEKYRRQPSQIAICVDTDTFLRVSATDKDGALGPTARIDMEVEGYYAALNALGHQVDVVYMEQLKQGVASRYKALILPGTELMDDALAKNLRDFVEGGGTLLAAGAFAEADRWNRPAAKVPGNGLDEVFGITIAGPGADKGKMMQNPDLWLDTPIQKVTLAGAKAVSTLDDGASPALTLKEFGKGRAYYLNGRPGNAYFHDGYKLRDLLAKVLAPLKPGPHFIGKGAVDLSALHDNATGNVLLVAATHGAEGKLPPVIEPGQIKLAGGPYKAAYAFAPLRQEGDGWSSSGPVPLEISENSVKLDKLDSAVAILLVKERAAPLIAFRLKNTPGKFGAEMKATIYNPSPDPLKGGVKLAQMPEATAIEVPPFGQLETAGSVTLDSPPTDRLPVQAHFQRPGQPDVVSGSLDIEGK